ncbi:D-alanine--D-alanine ligase [Vibrio parahaemolyticus]|uniref:D-alanine--D-alanine ligase n=1 Tax=Vibrio parahaemolyticus TaxID=670 RepID=UPI00038E4DD6|nr:D-alanine--D-alanine ligase [Vibrio parahaemolyticus]EJG0919537.1 D-alanine--D-alanine ligase [Vibrio parahaemolyticus O1:K68]EJG0929571.1 D-alanine--D-alanine ligase [Vibrio parahaemolyticus O1]EJG0943363.1 D-alanine--D-alanine ligase [Vibrio parahaemolyticus O10]EQM51697.1 D-alanine--D-alanine ligase family protein [Vibrio parahaemolyticus VPCR-2010]EGQ9060639.1 D-alanine--D-alanine ligase [Vibrio parahaemolyticus]
MIKNILLLCGGGSSEHEISLLSANFVEQQLNLIQNVKVTRVEIKNEGWVTVQGELVYLDLNTKQLCSNESNQTIDFIVPCIHGFPGETGDIQSLFEIAGIPYLGCGPEASSNSFNKITSKLWYDALDIPNTPYLFLTRNDEYAHKQAEQAFEKWGKVFVKAARQGSSVGCYSVTKKQAIAKAVNDAFGYSDQVLVEKAVKPRELEVAAYEMNGELHITKPGEVIAPDGAFYSYDEKYSSSSHSLTEVEAKNLTQEQIDKIHHASETVFKQMNLRHLSRIDFFLTEDNEIYLNEVNTFPGMTPISMFPKMLQNNGHKFHEFLEDCINSAK